MTGLEAIHANYIISMFVFSMTNQWYLCHLFN